eukprot:TRINITY_DN5541_c0_g1_i1.p1 TRINITY_DN5541_c0_g1~~TRINITY_DN5541_c0_g1_i1.p1  ORF type:complete len:240 (+),score=54.08 TRINITY_DN5541_c0_g1_i1:88-807(+)
MSDRRTVSSRAESIGRSAYSILFRNRGHARNRSQTDSPVELESEEWDRIQKSIERIVLQGSPDEPIDQISGNVSILLQQKSATVLVQGLKSTLSQTAKILMSELSNVQEPLFLARLKDLWRMFNAVSVPYIQAAFLSISPQQVQKELFFTSIYHMCHSVFRDSILLSEHTIPQVVNELSQPSPDAEILQMVGTLSHLSTKDANQEQFKDAYADLLTKSLASRAQLMSRLDSGFDDYLPE